MTSVEKASYKFKHIESNLFKLLQQLLSCENFKKYIYYDDSNNPLSEPDITENLIDTGHIVLTPYEEDILDDEMIKVFINPLKGKLRHQPLSNLDYVIDIIIPTRKWILHGRGELRGFRAADEIAQLIDEKDILGIGKCVIDDFEVFKLNNHYSGLSMKINVNSSTQKDFR